MAWSAWNPILRSLETGPTWWTCPAAEEQAESRALELLRPRLERLQSGLEKAYASWLSEDYYVVLVYDAPATAQ